MRAGTILLSLLVFIFPDSAQAGSGTDLLAKANTLIQTGGDNDLTPGAGLFKRRRSRTGGTVLITKSELINIHAHSSLNTVRSRKNYTYTGQFRLTDENGGVGVTFHSNYTSADEYYRLRQYAGNSFHVAPHGTSITSGNSDTGVVPVPKRWYKFKVRVTTGASSTRIRAKVWRAKKREPRGWQVDCEDNSSTRFMSGKPGVWSMAAGKKFWRELVVK